MNEPVATRPRRRYLVVAISIAAILFAVVIWVGPVVLFFYDYSQARHDFPLRHSEAREIIEFVYSYRSRLGQWPTLTEVQAQQFGALKSREWTYYADEGIDDAPVLILHGPYHMRLAYHFEPPRQGKINDDWSLSNEGDKSYFKADAPYSIQR